MKGKSKNSSFTVEHHDGEDACSDNSKMKKMLLIIITIMGSSISADKDAFVRNMKAHIMAILCCLSYCTTKPTPLF